MNIETQTLDVLILYANHGRDFIGFMPVRARHTGGPSRSLALFISRLVIHDSEGRSYLKSETGALARLKSPESWQRLDRMIEKARAVRMERKNVDADH
jgi:hypothetical protein